MKEMCELRGRRGQKISACDSCYKRKIKCDAAKPNCSWCRHYRTSCVYQRERRRPGQSRRDDDHLGEENRENPYTEISLERRQIDHAIKHDTFRPTLALQSLACFTPSAAVDQEWARFKSGELVSADWLCREQLGGRDSSPLPLFPSSSRCTDFPTIDITILPARASVMTYASLYMGSMMQVTFPILNPLNFEETMRVAYESTEHGHFRITTARACIIAFSVFAYLVPLGVRVCSTLRFNEYVNILKQNLFKISEKATVEGFQACIFLLLSQYFTGKLKSAAISSSVAAHFVFHFGAHEAWPKQHLTQIPGSSSGYTSTHLRNLFWVCYTIDKDLCWRVRQPPALSDNYCDLSLSLQYLEEISPKITNGFPFERVHPSLMFPTDIKLAQIKSRAYESLYTKAASRKCTTELRDIQNLGDSLETWRLAIPEKHRPSLAVSDHMQSDPENIDIRTLIIRLEYLHCMTVINRASNQCLKNNMSFDGAETVIALSISLAVEASRSSLRYLQAAYHILSKGAYWLVLFYPLTASVTILCNILDNPALPSAAMDYQLVKNVPQLFCDMSTYSLDTEELRHRGKLESFVKELIDHAKCAISSVT